MQEAGTVHLVGAGPGDPDLITVRGRRLIEEADAIVYDALVNPVMLEWGKSGCERYFVGKRSGRHACSQQCIEVLLVALARQGKNVVRLKGGDPFIFGRGGEEAQHLAKEGIAFTVVPAVTAALAAAAHAGVPLTHRDHSASVTFLSGHEDPSRGKPGIDWAAHARTGATLCLYMAMGRLEAICRELVQGGLKDETPVAVIQWAGTAKQRKLHSQLDRAATDARKADIGSPAIVVIGEVARLGPQLEWFQPEQAEDSLATQLQLAM